MIIEIDKSFEKDFKKINNTEIEKRILNRIEILEKINRLGGISNIKQMKGFSNFYRIRVGDYRIGFKLEVGSIIVLLRVRNRKDIYNIFP